MGDLVLYLDRMSQPCRALIIFCKFNDIPFVEHKVQIGKREHQSPAFTAKFPLAKLPAMDDGGFLLCESHAILRYLAETRRVPGYWYPKEAHARARVDMLLDWHHTNLRRGSAGSVMQEVLAPLRGLPQSPDLKAEANTFLRNSLATMDSLWLADTSPFVSSTNARGTFLLGMAQPSIADLSMACELLQVEMLGPDRLPQALAPVPRVQHWLESVRGALSPHFDEAHVMFRAIIVRMRQQKDGRSSTASRERGGQGAGGEGSSRAGGSEGFKEGAEMGRLYSVDGALRLPQGGGEAVGKEGSGADAGGYKEGADMGRLYSVQGALRIPKNAESKL